MKKWLRKDAKLIVFFDFSNHARARVPIFTPKMKNSRFARPARLSTRKWDFRRRSRPRELAQRSQDDVSLNKLPQINVRKRTAETCVALIVYLRVLVSNIRRLLPFFAPCAAALQQLHAFEWACNWTSNHWRATCNHWRATW